MQVLRVQGVGPALWRSQDVSASPPHQTSLVCFGDFRGLLSGFLTVGPRRYRLRIAPRPWELGSCTSA